MSCYGRCLLAIKTIQFLKLVRISVRIPAFVLVASVNTSQVSVLCDPLCSHRASFSLLPVTAVGKF